MADFEDSSTPTWTNLLDGQINLKDAIRRQIDFKVAGTGKEYKLNAEHATLMVRFHLEMKFSSVLMLHGSLLVQVRPRGWHLDEKNISVNGTRMSGSLFDFGLYFYHNAKELLNRGYGPVRKLFNFEEQILKLSALVNGCSISTCRNWKVIWKLVSGTMCLSSLRMNSEFPTVCIFDSLGLYVSL